MDRIIVDPFDSDKTIDEHIAAVAALFPAPDSVEKYENVILVKVHDAGGEDPQDYVMPRLMNAGFEAAVWLWDDWHA